MNRKSFLKNIFGLAIASTVGAQIISCSSNDEETPAPTNPGNGSGSGSGSNGNCGQNGTTNTIGSNHGHTLTVSKNDVNSGAAKTYDIKGSSGHAHSVTVTAAHFSDLKNNKAVTITSTSGGGHTHSVTISCA